MTFSPHIFLHRGPSTRKAVTCRWSMTPQRRRRLDARGHPRHLAVANVQAEKYAAAKNCVEAMSTEIDGSRITPNLEFTMRYVSLRATWALALSTRQAAAAAAMVAHPSAKFKSCTPALIQLVTASPQTATIVVQMFVTLIASTSRDASDDRETIPKAAASLLEAILDASEARQLGRSRGCRVGARFRRFSQPRPPDGRSR